MKSLYLKLTLQGEITESTSTIPFLGGRSSMSLRDIVETLDAATRRPRVRLVLLVIRSISISWAQIEEIRQALERFHEAGKDSVAYLEGGGDHKILYLAAGAQQTITSPGSSIDLVGLRSEGLYLRGLLESLGIEPQVLAVGEFKSAGEIFTRHGMSEPHRRMLRSILSDLQIRLLAALSRQTGLPPERLQELMDDGPFSAQRAVQAGLVNGTGYEEDLEQKYRQSSPPLVPISPRRLHRRPGFIRRILKRRQAQIALIVLEGVIAYGAARRGPGPIRVSGSQGLVELIRAARKSRRVKAIVLRVNSPGGSGLASDLIWRELKAADHEKPVIVSMGGTAASGGYYVATAARRIIAGSSTLTGSIGIVGGKLSFRNLLRRLRVGLDLEETGRHAGFSSPTRRFSEREQEILQQQMNDFYERLFLPKVAEGRGLPIDEVRDLAGGRVWTGAQAQSQGLVDEVGGLSTALETARQAAGYAPGQLRLVEYTQRRRLRDLLPLGVEASGSRERLWLLWYDPFEVV